MNRKTFFSLSSFVLLFALNSPAQSVYLKDVRHLGIPCVLLGNEKTGVVVPKDPAPGSAMNQMLLAPIQALRFADGSFSDNELNYLEPASDVRQCSTYPFYTDGYAAKEFPLKSRTLGILKQTPSEISIIIKYAFLKPDNKGTRDNRGDKGYYTCTLTLKAGEPVVMVEEETDCNLSYKFETGTNMYNRARYRGRYSNSIEEGYMIENGKKTLYLNETGFPGREATVDLSYETQYPSCKPYRNYPSLSFWNVWPTGTGWYWELYSSSGSAQSPAVGIFSGRASRLIGANCAQVNFFTREDNHGTGVRVNILRMDPAQYFSKMVRVQWGLYLGSQAADIVAYDAASPILKWFNRKSGLAEKMDAYEKQLPAVAPEFEWAAFYQDKNAIQQMILKAKNDAGFVKSLAALDYDYATLFNAWAGDACAAEKTYQVLKAHYEGFKEMMINGQGIYSYNYTKKFSGPCVESEVTNDLSHYVRASDWFKRDVLTASALMAAAKAGTVKLTDAQKNNLKMYAGVYARIVWDDDFAPMAYDPKTPSDAVNIDHGVPYGQTNMYVIYQTGRDFFALLFRNDPAFRPKYDGIVKRCKATINENINDAGASGASPHYTEPTLEGLVLLLLQLKQQGNNFFETEPKLKAFARFYLNLLTPPSVRFANNRKLTSFGDGSEESAALFGLLATGFRSAKPELNQLANDLDAAYHNGPMRNLPKAGMMTLVYDFSKDGGTTSISSLQSMSAPGYLSHFRSVPNTPRETAIWMLNGNFYSDHRNDDDGELSIYALRAPLSLSRSSFYDPYVNSATIRSMVVPFKDFPGWSGNNQAITYGNQFKRTWQQSGLNRYAYFASSGFASAMMGKDNNTWKRDLLFYHANESYPIIVIKDELSNRDQHIWSMPFFSEGAVQLPDNTLVNTSAPGDCITQRINPNAAAIKGRTEWPLGREWNRFSFTGQEWRNYDPQQKVNGIDWWVYSYNADNNVSASLTEWTNFYIPGPEMQEFEKTHPYKFDKNCVAKDPSIHYRETQQILRLKGSGRFINIIMPFRKGEAPAACSVKQNGDQQFTITRTVNNTAEIITVTPGGLVMYSPQKTIISAFDAGTVTSSASTANITVSGGVTELVMENNKVQVTVPLSSGNRNIVLPAGNWKITNQPANVSLALSGNKLTIITGAANGNISSNTADMVSVGLAK